MLKILILLIWFKTDQHAVFLLSNLAQHTLCLLRVFPQHLKVEGIFVILPYPCFKTYSWILFIYLLYPENLKANPNCHVLEYSRNSYSFLSFRFHEDFDEE